MVWAGRKDDDVGASRRRAPGGVGGGGRRISPAPLRRDDARRRPADRLRRRRRTAAADRLLVRSRGEPLQPFLVQRTTTTAKRSAAFARSRAVAAARRTARSTGRDRAIIRHCRRGCGSRAAPQAQRSRADLSVRGIRGGSWRRGCVSPRVSGRAAQGACPRPHRSSADAVVARYSTGRPQGRDRATI